MVIAAVRVRGTTLAREDVIDTLRMLRLTRANHCVMLPDIPSTRGMLQKVREYVTWGSTTPEVLARLLLKRGRIVGGKGLTDAYVKANSRYKSIWDLSQAIVKGEAGTKDVKGLNPVLRLPPPRKGYKSVKLAFASGGDFGDRGKEIDSLLTRMIGEDK